MRSFIFPVVVFVTYFTLKACFQNLYKLEHERCEVTQVNRSLVNLTFKCYKLSRNELFLNISMTPLVNIRTDQEGQVLVTGYQFRSNQYRKGPIEFKMGLCSGMKRKDFDIPHLIAVSNLSCPVVKGERIHVDKYRPNETNFPPLIPDGRWKMEVKYLYYNKYVICSVDWYVKIVYPVPFRDE